MRPVAREQNLFQFRVARRWEMIWGRNRKSIPDGKNCSRDLALVQMEEKRKE